jgi:hypothetical protein
MFVHRRVALDKDEGLVKRKNPDPSTSSGQAMGTQLYWSEVSHPPAHRDKAADPVGTPTGHSFSWLMVILRG